MQHYFYDKICFIIYIINVENIFIKKQLSLLYEFISLFQMERNSKAENALIYYFNFLRTLVDSFINFVFQFKKYILIRWIIVVILALFSIHRIKDSLKLILGLVAFSVYFVMKYFFPKMEMFKLKNDQSLPNSLQNDKKIIKESYEFMLWRREFILLLVIDFLSLFLEK